jgi:hypothetical protein
VEPTRAQLWRDVHSKRRTLTFPTPLVRITIATIRIMRAVILLALPLAAVSCTEPTQTAVGADEAVTLARVAPVAPAGAAGATLDSSLLVKLTGGDGRGLRGHTLNVTVLAGEGAASATRTDAAGMATITWQLGTRADSQRLRISSSAGRGAHMEIALVARPGPPAGIEVASPLPSMLLADSVPLLEIFVVRDRFGNRIASSTAVGGMTWAVDSGSAVNVSPSGQAVGVAQGASRLRLNVGNAQAAATVRVLAYSTRRIALPDTGMAVAWTRSGVVALRLGPGVQQVRLSRHLGGTWHSEEFSSISWFVAEDGVLWSVDTLSGARLRRSAASGSWSERALPRAGMVPFVRGASGDTVYLFHRDTIWRSTSSGSSVFAPGASAAAAVEGDVVYDVRYVQTPAPEIGARRFSGGAWSALPMASPPAEASGSPFLLTFQAGHPSGGAMFLGIHSRPACSCALPRYLLRIGPDSVRIIRTRAQSPLSDPLRDVFFVGIGLPGGPIALVSPGQVEIIRSPADREVIHFAANREARTMVPLYRSARASPGGEIHIVVREGGREYILAIDLTP